MRDDSEVYSECSDLFADPDKEEALEDMKREIMKNKKKCRRKH